VNGAPSFTIISNRCAHLGCPVQPGGPIFEDKKKTATSSGGEEVTIIPMLPAGGFVCPCHGGAYDQEGNRVAGPPVRALDRYDFEVDSGRLVLLGTYSVAKVDGTGAGAKIFKYKLQNPGDPVRASSRGSIRCSRPPDGDRPVQEARFDRLSQTLGARRIVVHDENGNFEQWCSTN